VSITKSTEWNFRKGKVMTVAELIEHLKTLPQDAECVIEVPFDGNGPATTVKLPDYAVVETRQGHVLFTWDHYPEGEEI
jgi:hypothetical protein